MAAAGGSAGRAGHLRSAGWLALAVVALAALAGCAGGPRPVPDDRERAWQELRARLQALDAWRAQGRLGVRMDGEGGQAGFTWIEAADGGFRLRLSGPWGQGAARLHGDADAAELITGDGRRYAGQDARGLLAAVYGWELPVAGLRSWLIGLPARGAEYTLDRFGRLESLESGGWRIEYGRFRRVGEVELPAVLRAHHAASDTEVRIAVDAWDIGAGGGGEPAPGSPVPLIGG